MSECSTFISGSPARPADPDTLGRPQPGRRVALIAEGAPAAQGSPGTIAIHHSDPGLMLGYLDAPEQTRARYEGEWFLTGDQGVMDAGGQIAYLGRRDDMMNAGGFRVSPLEVEAALSGAPGVDAIAVTEVEIKPGVRVIAAFYTGPAALDAGALEGYAETKLARYKQPRLYRHLPALPLSANGKLQRRALREQFEAERNV
jgi:acyl-coenzyme A synthetase/AMP-(fatty) acid ligase